MASHAAIERRVDTAITASTERLSHLKWFLGGSILGFLVPFVFSSMLELHHDLYYLIYFAIVGAFLGMYVVTHEIDLVAFFKQGIRLSVILGIPIAAFVVMNVLSRDSTPRPDGVYFAFEVVWRGLAYGIVDALFLTAFPALVAFGIIGGALKGIRQRVAFAAIVLALTIVITGTYHLGYDQFRENGVGQPELGNTIISVPTLVTGNPVGSIIAHSSMHVTATSHSYETNVFLPPQTNVD